MSPVHGSPPLRLVQLSSPGRLRVRQTISLGLLALVCAMLVPLPGSTPHSPEKDLSQPFPCQHRSCGCLSADQCWKKCCCFTNREKVAWAEKARVDVPEFVRAAAEAEPARTTHRMASAPAASAPAAPACEKCAEGTCSSQPPAEDAGPCELMTKHDARRSLSPAKTPLARNVSGRETRRGRMFSGLEALKCQGLTSLLQILSASSLPPAATGVSAGDDKSAPLTERPCHLRSCDRETPDPPPRLRALRQPFA